MAYKKKRSFIKRRPVKRRSYARKSGGKALKRTIRKVVQSSAEKKQAEIYNLAMPIRSSIHGSFTSQIFQVNPCAANLNILQGVGQGARVGNRIMIRNLTLKGSIVAQPYSATVNTNPFPSQIKMFLFGAKDVGPNVQPTVLTDFFQLGNTTAGLQNDLVDMWCPVNTDIYTVYATRMFKVGYSAANGTGTSADNESFANNDFKFNANFNINLTKMVPKIVRYNDNNGNPLSRSLWCMFLPVRADGQPMSSSTTCATAQWVLSMSYTDI